ncbi:zinc ribbon domain-containing protein [Microseira wollei]|uniref:Zinc-ribbon domain-containing protein n=1 Tax=Microseira wollei NIES-4236 TaxID=2530354 RepID=A0AAV3X1F1_9CYAN|nr:zinc ribbon domain-containing protein [Microseira wollei]GET36542.1 hypothetical protein MiSe_12930 [Microseira wollei NIES-4236]
MPYVCELGRGQRVYLDNQGTQTIVTTASSSPGQQQQSSSSFTTGSWTAPPEIFQIPNGVTVKVETEAGSRFIQIQGNSISTTAFAPSFTSSQQLQIQQVDSTSASSMPPMQPMQPMKPIEPMKPMEMRMGNMEMRMGSSRSVSESTPGERRFCPQCGSKVESSDRFCSSCGHRLI